jgi:hypothetical protein
MKRYRLIEVGCSRELYAIASDDGDERDERTVARFTVSAGENPSWMRETLRAFGGHVNDRSSSSKMTSAYTSSAVTSP